MLLTAWVEDSTQTVMTATEVAPEEHEHLGDGLGVASKGYQQITSWQVYTVFLTGCDALPETSGCRLF